MSEQPAMKDEPKPDPYVEATSRIIDAALDDNSPTTLVTYLLRELFVPREDYLDSHERKMELFNENAALQADNAKLVAALERIAARSKDEGGCYYKNISSIEDARAALSAHRKEEGKRANRQ